MRISPSNLSFSSLAPFSLAALLACNGTSSSNVNPSPAAAQMDTTEAATLSASFLDMENNQAGELDGSGAFAAGEAMAVQLPEHPSCVSVSNATLGSVTWTFNACTGPHGWTWNGVTVISWTVNPDGTRLVKHDRRNMVGTKEGKTWTINGIKDHLINPTAKTVQIYAEPGFTKVLKDGATTTNYLYTCNLTANRAEEGKRKLFGTWAMTPATGDAISGSISQATPLVWEKAANCCHPVSGTMTLTKGAKEAIIVHSLPCGSITVNGTAKTLGACAS